MTRPAVAPVALLSLLLVGCATAPNAKKDPRDPLEGFNRASYKFNDALDRAVLKPAAKGYKAVTPDFVESGVTKIKGISIKRPVSNASVGAARVGASVGGRFVASDLEVEVVMSQAKSFFDWFETFAISRSTPEERNGKIEILGPDLKAVLCTVTLGGVGISALRIAQQEANTERVSSAQATIYVERLTFS